MVSLDIPPTKDLASRFVLENYLVKGFRIFREPLGDKLVFGVTRRQGFGGQKGAKWLVLIGCVEEYATEEIEPKKNQVANVRKE
jgi:hypothetical protein